MVSYFQQTRKTFKCKIHFLPTAVVPSSSHTLFPNSHTLPSNSQTPTSNIYTPQARNALNTHMLQTTASGDAGDNHLLQGGHLFLDSDDVVVDARVALEQTLPTHRYLAGQAPEGQAGFVLRTRLLQKGRGIERRCYTPLKEERKEGRRK